MIDVVPLDGMDCVGAFPSFPKVHDTTNRECSVPRFQLQTDQINPLCLYVILKQFPWSTFIQYQHRISSYCRNRSSARSDLRHLHDTNNRKHSESRFNFYNIKSSFFFVKCNVLSMAHLHSSISAQPIDMTNCFNNYRNSARSARRRSSMTRALLWNSKWGCKKLESFSSRPSTCLVVTDDCRSVPIGDDGAPTDVASASTTAETPFCSAFLMSHKSRRGVALSASATHHIVLGLRGVERSGKDVKTLRIDAVSWWYKM